MHSIWPPDPWCSTNRSADLLPSSTAYLLTLALGGWLPGAAAAASEADAESARLDAESSGTSYRFVVMADSRGPSTADFLNEAALQGLMVAVAPLAPPFIFFTGDLTMGVPYQHTTEWPIWETIINSIGKPVYEVFGGHERQCNELDCPAMPATDAWASFGTFFDPAGQSADCHYYDGSHNPPDSTDSNYSHTAYYCDFGGDRFFVVNNDCVPECDSLVRQEPACTFVKPAPANVCVGHEIGCAQFNWVREKLVGNGKRYNFFFHHEPAYGVGAHDAHSVGDPACPATLSRTMDNKASPRDNWVRLLGYNNGTLIFSGHEHHYSRRRIDHAFVDAAVNNPSTAPQLNSLAILVEPVSFGTNAQAFSVDQEPTKATELWLWWSGHGWDKYPILSSRDDAEELEGGRVSYSSSDLDIRTSPDRTVGLRWTNIAIRGGTLEEAKIRFVATETMAGPGPGVSLVGEATPFAFPFSQCVEDLTIRPRTTASASWQIGTWQAGGEYFSPDITVIIQELFDNHGFGTRFDGEIVEIKTGSAGAPWNSRSCSAFMGNIESDLIHPQGLSEPFHYALVTVSDAGVEVEVKTASGIVLSPVLGVTRTGDGSGTVTSSPQGIDCGTDCVHTYGYNDLVLLSATPDANSTFDGWSGDCNAFGQVTMIGHKSCEARFLPDTFQLAITKSGAGSGSVTSFPHGLSCGSVCSHDFTNGAQVNLSATPDLGSEFDGWGGHADCTDGTVTMDGNKTCNAAFGPCTMQSVVDLPGQTVSSDQDFHACNVLRAGVGGFIVEGAGTDVGFYAGNQVELYDGFELRQGSTLKVVLAPPT